MIFFLFAKFPQAAHGKHPDCGENNGTDEYSGTTGSSLNGAIYLNGKSVICCDAVVIDGILTRVLCNILLSG